MLKDHDRQIQEVVRRARLDKAKLRKLQGEGQQVPAKPYSASSIPLFASGREAV